MLDEKKLQAFSELAVGLTPAEWSAVQLGIENAFRKVQAKAVLDDAGKIFNSMWVEAIPFL